MSPANKEAYMNTFANGKNDDGGRRETVNGARGGNKRLDFRFVH